MREFDLLEHIYGGRGGLGGHVLIPPGDDMALLALRGRQVLAAVDQVVAGRHVKLETTPIALVGRKAIARSVSDIAAMAARPIGSIVADVLPPDFGEERAKALADAMREAAAELRCPLVGGDIAFHSDPSHPLTCSVTVLAEPVGGRVITRGGAQIGDAGYVTGSLGGSVQSDGLGRHLTFQPRVNEAIELASALGDRLHAMIDISDGLGRDASHVARESGVQIQLEAARIPCAEGCDWRRALMDGEDYELCFTASGDVPEQVGGVRLTRVGDVREAAGADGPWVIVEENGRMLAADEMGWQHES